MEWCLGGDSSGCGGGGWVGSWSGGGVVGEGLVVGWMRWMGWWDGVMVGGHGSGGGGRGGVGGGGVGGRVMAVVGRWWWMG